MSNSHTAKGEYRFEADLLRAIGSVLVIVHHTVILVYIRLGTVHASEWFFASFFRCITLYGVPLFILLSGALHLTKQNFDTRKMYKKMLKLTFVYICWSVVYVFGKYVLFSETKTVTEIILLILTGKTEYHLFFVPIIIWLYAITPILRKLFLPPNKKILYFVLVISFIYTLMSWVRSDWHVNQISSNYFQPTYALRYLCIYLLGGILWRTKKITPLIIITGIAFVELQLFVSTMYTYYYSRKLGYETLYLYLDRYYAPHYIAAAAVLFAIFKQISLSKINTTFKKLTQAWSKHSEFIYFFHPLLLYIFTYLLAIFGYGITDLSIYLLLVLSVFVGLFSFLFSKIAAYICYASKKLLCDC